VALMAVLAAAAAPLLPGVRGVAETGVAVGVLRFLAALVVVLGLVLRTGVAGVEIGISPSPVVWRPRVAGSRRRSFLL
jgi:hypothetical protein